MPLLLLFVVLPIVEMWLLIEVGSRIGALVTIGLVFLTAFVGVLLLRQQGLSTLARASQRMETGEIPAEEMVAGIFLAVGGALLLTPGFLTDAIGFACLLPGVRQLLIGRLLKRVLFAPGANTSFYSAYYRSQGHQEDIIEGEFRRDDVPTHGGDRLQQGDKPLQRDNDNSGV